MKTNLLHNSFAVLGVSITADRGAIARAFEDALFDAEPADEAILDRARQEILAPRSRLEAELSFVMQIGAGDFAAFMKDMRQSGRSDLATAFVGLDRANYMAHHCRPGMGRKGLGNARALVREHDGIESARVMEVLQAARRQSGFGPVGQDEFDSAFATWRRNHAECALSVLDSNGDLPALLSQLIEARGREGLVRGLMPAVLREYENRHAATLEAMAQTVLERLAELRESGVSIAAFAKALKAWDGLAQPPSTGRPGARHRRKPFKDTVPGNPRKLSRAQQPGRSARTRLADYTGCTRRFRRIARCRRSAGAGRGNP